MAAADAQTTSAAPAAATTATSDQEVSNFAGDLLAAVEQAIVPKPGLMEYNDWIRWRRDHGRRPLAAVDGASTSSRFESDLWKKVIY